MGYFTVNFHVHIHSLLNCTVFRRKLPTLHLLCSSVTPGLFDAREANMFCCHSAAVLLSSPMCYTFGSQSQAHAHDAIVYVSSCLKPQEPMWSASGLDTKAAVYSSQTVYHHSQKILLSSTCLSCHEAQSGVYTRSAQAASYSCKGFLRI